MFPGANDGSELPFGVEGPFTGGQGAQPPGMFGDIPAIDDEEFLGAIEQTASEGNKATDVVDVGLHFFDRIKDA